MNLYEQEGGHEMSHEVDKEHLNEEFKVQYALLEAVNEAGGCESYVEAHAAEVGEAFKNLAPAAACMDERVVRTSSSDSRPAKFGGALALADEDELAEFCEHAGVDPTTHDHCGAGALEAERIGRAGEGDQVAREKLGRVAVKAGRKLLESPLDGPTDHHNAVCVYVVGRGNGFGPTNAKNAKGEVVLPTGFVVSDILGKDQVVHDLGLSIDIALGSHGFGELLDEEHPFTVIAVAESDEELEEVEGELATAVNAANAKYGDGRVAFDGFVKPERA